MPIATKKLVEEAYKCANYAAELTQELWDLTEAKKPLPRSLVTNLLNQSRSLASTVQVIEERAKGNPPPKEG